jgi:type VI secretion system protein ImpD
LPRILIRQPYNTNGIRLAQRSFKEILLSHDDYLWGNACYAYASIVIKSFEQTGWFMNMRGVGQEQFSSEQLTTIRDRFISNKNTFSEKIITEFLVTDAQEKMLNDAGLISLKDHRLAKKAVFYSSQSIKLPKRSANDMDFTQSRINTMLHYVLCASRFAHYIKVIIRDKIGSFTSVEDCEAFMTKWLSQYCSSAKGQSLISIMKSPLTGADVSVREITGNPGKYYCAMSISPHSQFDDIQSQLKLVTNVRL